MKRCLIPRSTHCRQRLATDTRGVAVIEFALLSPVVILVILGGLQMGLAGWAKSTLENGLRDAARFAITGNDNVDTGLGREAAIKDLIEKRMSSFPLAAGGNIELVTKVYSSFEDVGRPEPEDNGNGVCEPGEHFTDVNGNGVFDMDAARSGYGSANEVVIYTVKYPLRAVVPLVGRLLPTEGVFNLTASATVQNEPYGIAGSTPAILPC